MSPCNTSKTFFRRFFSHTVSTKIFGSSLVWPCYERIRLAARMFLHENWMFEIICQTVVARERSRWIQSVLLLLFWFIPIFSFFHLDCSNSLRPLEEYHKLMWEEPMSRCIWMFNSFWSFWGRTVGKLLIRIKRNCIWIEWLFRTFAMASSMWHSLRTGWWWIVVDVSKSAAQQ